MLYLYILGNLVSLSCIKYVEHSYRYVQLFCRLHNACLSSKVNIHKHTYCVCICDIVIQFLQNIVILQKLTLYYKQC